jgi:mRNA-degrading endonuclease toxin of MazEF toxin-antitoxin module
MEKDLIYQRGCICWYTDPMFREDDSYILRGKRPAVVVTSDTINEISATVVIVPMTTATDKRLYPGQFDIFLKGITSRVRCDQLRVVDKASLSEPYATLNDECMEAMDAALLATLGMEALIPEGESEEEYETVAKLVKSY